MARTHLLTWNPDKWVDLNSQWDDWVDRTASGQNVEDNWSVGIRRHGIEKGDAVFFLRQGVRGRGVLAAGRTTSRIFQGQHWDGSGRPANYVSVAWETCLPVDERLDIALLQNEVPSLNWNQVYWSGRTLDEAVARELATVWDDYVWADWTEPGETTFEYIEGTAKRIWVNRYERDPRARARCIAHWGYICSVCTFDFNLEYGSIGREYIQVHHLKSLASMGGSKRVDPVVDMRPMCANCHVMSHRQDPPISPASLRKRMRRARR
jgi:5-methylcytosine-specific restriction protein A